MADPPPKGPPALEVNKLTPWVHERIVALLREGNFRDVAAAAAGVPPHRLRWWLMRGERAAPGDEPYVRFADDVAAAEALTEARDVALVSKAATDDWKAAAWRLERASPSRWAARVRIEVDHQLNLFLDQLSAALPPEDFARVTAVATRLALGEPREPNGDDDP